MRSPSLLRPSLPLLVAFAVPLLAAQQGAAEECFRTLSPVATFSGHKDKIWPVAISPDGATVASGDRSGEVRLWSVMQKKLRQKLRAPSSAEAGRSEGAGTVDQLSFSADGKLLLVGWGNGTLRIGGTSAAAPKRVFSETGASALSPRGELLLSGQAQLRSPLSGKPLRAFPELGGESLAFSPDGKRLAVGRGARVELRSAQDGQLIGATQLGGESPERPLTADVVAFSPDGIWLAAGSEAHGQTEIYTLADPSQPRLVRRLSTTQFAFLPEARLAYAESISPTEERVSIIELPGSPWRTCLVAPRAGAEGGFAPAALAVNPSGVWLTASDRAAQRVHVWNLKALTAPPIPEPVGDETLVADE